MQESVTFPYSRSNYNETKICHIRRSRRVIHQWDCVIATPFSSRTIRTNDNHHFICIILYRRVYAVRLMRSILTRTNIQPTRWFIHSHSRGECVLLIVDTEWHIEEWKQDRILLFVVRVLLALSKTEAILNTVTNGWFVDCYDRCVYSSHNNNNITRVLIKQNLKFDKRRI